MKGVHQELRAKFHKSVQNYVIVSRILQGQDDFRTASVQEKEDIALRLKDVLSRDVLSSIDASRAKAKKKASGDEEEEEYTGPLPDEEPKTGFFQTRHLSLEERKKLHAVKKAWKKRNEGRTTASTSTSDVGTITSSSNQSVATPSSSSPQPSSTPSVLSTPSILDPDNEDMEQAIRESVAQTSTGDRDEDARIEAQIRISVQEMRRVAEANRRQQQMRDWKNPPRSSTPSSTLVAAPSSSASSMTAVGGATSPDWRSSAKGQQETAGLPNDISDEEYETLIAEAVRQSMMAQVQAHQQGPPSGETFDAEEQHQGITMTDNTLEQPNSNAYELGGNQEDEYLTRAMQESMRSSSRQQVLAGDGDNEEDAEFKRAMEESARAHEEHLARASSQRTEEEIIMEYVKKQSLAEEEFRQKAAKGKQTAREGGAGDDDEDLKRALEESLRMSGKEGGPSAG